MNKRSVWGSLVGLTLLWATGCTTLPLDDDQGLRNAVLQRLNQDELIRRTMINVTARQGVITLMGQIPDDALRLRAVSIVRGTPGVREVEDHLRRP